MEKGKGEIVGDLKRKTANVGDDGRRGENGVESSGNTNCLCQDLDVLQI